MPRPCSLCVHPERAAIDHAFVAGAPCREITVSYGVSMSAADRHKGHLPATLVQAREAAAVADADALLAEANTLYQHARAILTESRGVGDHKTALRAIDSAGRVLALLGELLGEINRQPQVNVLVMPEWLAIRGALIDALRPYPEARAAVAAVLGAA